MNGDPSTTTDLATHHQETGYFSLLAASPSPVLGSQKGQAGSRSRLAIPFCHVLLRARLLRHCLDPLLLN